MVRENRFVLKEAKSSQELKLHYRLRYEVYVEEMRSVKPQELSDKDRKDRLERDWYDQYSAHFLFLDTGTNKYIGAVRFIRDTPRGFLMEQSFNLPKDIDRGKTVELSRFLVTKDFRNADVRFDRHSIAIGMYRWSKKNDIQTWCSAMQVWLLYAFLKDGVAFELLGPIQKGYHNTAVVPSILKDLDAGVRYMWALNRPLHLRYANGREEPPLDKDKVDQILARVAHDKAMLLGKLKWLYPIGTVLQWLRKVRRKLR